MKIAYVTPYSSSDVHAWSGSVYFIREALKNAGCEILPVDNLRDSGKIFGKIREKATRAFSGKTYLSDRRPAVLDQYAKQVAARCEQLKPDIIFSPGTIPIARLKTNIPTVFWTDATFAGITNYYPDFSNLTAATVRDGNEVDRLALGNCSLAIYTSDWAARSAIENYNADPAKVKTVPYGANLTSGKSETEIHEIIRSKPHDVINLLFIGVNWERKGGAIALETACVLNQRGFKTQLHIVGVQPPGEVPDFVKIHGFISKKTPEGTALLDRLFSEAHFLIVPSRAECFGLVYAEASSCGLPSLAPATGGIPSVITPGTNGELFAYDASGEAYADSIVHLIQSEDAYQTLARNSLKEFNERLNWQSAGSKVVSLLAAL